MKRVMAVLVVVVAGAVFAGPKLNALKAVAKAVNQPTKAQCEQVADKVFELVLAELENDPELKKDFPNAKERAAAVTLARAELKKEKASMVKDEVANCIADGKSGAITQSTVSCLLAAKSMADFEACE